ncbi:MAG: exo-alpha-sialidase [Lentisphaeria bacterium]|nr:exo-alpha-sialidase [Lentisphaeria bacterium]
MKESVHDLMHGPDNPRNSEGSFLAAKDGRIRFIYTRYSGESWGDHASADLAEMISTDGGETWQDRGVIIRRGDAKNIMSVSLLRLQDGSVRMFYLEKRARSGGSVACIPMMRRSDDDGESWSEAKRLIEHEGYYVMNNDRVIQLSSGRIVLPVSFHAWRSGGRLRPGVVFTLFSDDNGETWSESDAMLMPELQSESRNGFQEPGVIELEPGKLLLWIRTSRGFQYRSISTDGGNTWSQPVADFDFPSPCSPMSMKRDPATGYLYAVWNGTDRILYPVLPKTTDRTPLVLMRSRDNGANWEKTGAVLLEKEPDHGYCYTAMLFRGDSLLLAYCCGRHGNGASQLQDLRIRKINLTDL